MARPEQTTNLVNFIFGFSKKARGRTGKRPRPPIQLSAGTMDPIERDAFNHVMHSVGAFGEVTGGTVKAGFDIGADPFYSVLNKAFVREGGIDYVYDPNDGYYKDPSGNRLKRGGVDVTFDMILKQDSPIDAMTSRVGLKRSASWWQKTRLLLGQQRGLTGTLMSAYNFATDFSEKRGAYVLDFVKRNLLTRVAAPRYRRLVEERVRSSLSATGLPAVAVDSYVADAMRYVDGVMVPGMQVVMWGDLGWSDIASRLYYGGTVSKDMSGVDAPQDALRLQVAGSTSRKSIHEMKSGSIAERAVARALEEVLDRMKPTSSGWGMLTMLTKSGGPVGGLLSPEPGANILNVWRKFILTNMGYHEIAMNPMLMHVARVYGGRWANFRQWALVMRDSHWISKRFFTPAMKIGQRVGQAAASQIAKISAKAGTKGILHVVGQALGVSAPVIGNIVSFIIIELLYKIVIDPLFKVVKEVLKVIAWAFLVCLIFLGIFIGFFLTLIPGSPGISGRQVITSGSGATGTGGGFFESEERPTDATGEVPVIYSTVPWDIQFSDGTCPFEEEVFNQMVCTQGYSASGVSDFHRNQLAIDLASGEGGLPVFSPCKGTASPTPQIAGCAGEPGMGVRITCNEGTTVTYLHVVPLVIQGSTVIPGQQVGYLARGRGSCSTGPHLHVNCRDTSTGQPIPADECLNAMGCPEIDESECLIPD